MRRKALSAVPSAMTTIAVVLSVAALFLVEVNRGDINEADSTGSAILAISFALVGGLVAAKSGNVIGWLMLVSGFFGSFNAVTGEYSQAALEHGWPLRAASAWIAVWAWAGSAVVYPLVLLLFPTGRPPSRRWWPVAAVAVAAGVAAAIGPAIESWRLAWGRELTGEQVFEDRKSVV